MISDKQTRVTYGKPALLNQKLYSKPACKSSQILSQWKPWSNKNIVKQMPPGWLIIGILSFLLKGKLCIFPIKCCLTQECFGVGSWNLFSGLFVRDFLFMLLFYRKKKFLKRSALNPYCHKRLLIPWLSLLKYHVNNYCIICACSWMLFQFEINVEFRRTVNTQS